MIRHPEFADIIPCACNDGEIYKLRQDFIYRNFNTEIIARKNFEYDGASVPRIFWTISNLTPDGLIRNAALVHDCIYIAKGKKGIYIGEFSLSKNFTRKEADKLLKTIALENGVSKFQANLAYYAVRLGGYITWKN